MVDWNALIAQQGPSSPPGSAGESSPVVKVDYPALPQAPTDAYAFLTGGQSTLNHAASPSPNAKGVQAIQGTNSSPSGLGGDPGAGAKALAAQEQAQTAPLVSALGQVYAQPRPAPPNLQAQLEGLPSVKNYIQMIEQAKKASQDWMGTAGILSGLVGAFSRKHTTLALKAFSSAVDGFKKGQMDQFKSNMDTFKQASSQAVQNANFLQKQYEDVLNDRTLSAKEIMDQIHAIAETYHDPIVAQNASTGDFFKIQSLLNQRQRLADSMTEQNETLANQVNELPYVSKDAMIDSARQMGGMMATSANQADSVLKYKLPLPVATTRDPQNRTALNLVTKAIENGYKYDAKMYAAYAAGVKKLQQSEVPPDIGKTEQSIQKVDNHLTLLQKSMDALGAGDVRKANEFAQGLGKELGDPKIVSAETAVAAVSQEFHRVYVPTGGVEDERAASASNISPSSSPAQIKAAIATMRELMAGQAKAIYLIDQTIRQGGDVVALNVPAAYVVKVAELGPAAAAQEGVTGEAGSSAEAEQTATDPKTGKKMIYRDGQWQDQ